MTPNLDAARKIVDDWWGFPTHITTRPAEYERLVQAIAAHTRAVVEEKAMESRLQHSAAVRWKDQYETLEQENERLRAAFVEQVKEIKRWSTLFDKVAGERGTLRAALAERTTDLENLRAQGVVQVQVDRQIIDALLAERERLRGALQDIAGHYYDSGMAVQIADDALAPEAEDNRA